MSRIGRKPVTLPKGVTAQIMDDSVKVTGPKGELSMSVVPSITISADGPVLTVTRASDAKPDKAFHGMTRALLANMVKGVSEGFKKDLEIIGVGWRAQMQGRKLILNLGFSHPVEYDPPQGIEITTDGPTKISVQGIDRQVVGQVASEIREYRPPEPYKGKGIRYVGEYVIRKAGKAGSK
ncbi:MAG: 50S ribosomal protein L6 [Synergistaceae bacterium]|jgi:large subunit ribosomal protein L6|nr:50S ribosomal protein L6 [Synergistaceae bacterium]